MVLKLKNNLSKKIFIKTFGCQMNEYDSNRILDLVKKEGYVATQNPSEADCYVLNTCHIREKATDKVYHDIGRLKKEFRKKKKPMLIVTGCVAQAENQEMLNRENYIDGVVGPQSYHQLPNIIKKIEENKSRVNSTDFEVIEKFDSLNLVKNSNSKTSSFLTIQEGCDKFCHFCVVPYTRGPEYSRSFNEIISEAKQLINNGTKEITLLGQNVNAYRYKDRTKIYHLSDLIFTLNNLKELKRIRYTTSHPKDVTKDLIEAHKSCVKLMPILHLPVQSGSSKILKSMNRKHNIEEYNKIVEELKAAKPNIKFSSDFIIGYPGETEFDFQQTLKLIEKTRFINSYSFVYSPRPGTPAPEITNVEKEKAKKRLIKLQEILEEINDQSKKNFLNKTIEVLFENKMKNQNKYFGRDQFLNSVVVESNKDITGQLINVKIKNYNHNSLFGEINEKKVGIMQLN
ncbi:tRNA (N6-isopentenyl adenosine(37)-C2)-methylthiotransferase MiaB [Pelagibacteraceae bacterium]|nr:tRNA (N6-isopentenyl adenosine(37)-C2)-methylthiotransferase MiaB [Pelagibacteraceae bacterium]